MILTLLLEDTTVISTHRDNHDVEKQNICHEK